MKTNLLNQSQSVVMMNKSNQLSYKFYYQIFKSTLVYLLNSESYVYLITGLIRPVLLYISDDVFGSVEIHSFLLYLFNRCKLKHIFSQ